MIEYSEISKEDAEMRDEHGELVYNQGSINNVLFRTDFIVELLKEENLEEYFK